MLGNFSYTNKIEWDIQFFVRNVLSVVLTILNGYPSRMGFGFASSAAENIGDWEFISPLSGCKIGENKTGDLISKSLYSCCPLFFTVSSFAGQLQWINGKSLNWTKWKVGGTTRPRSSWRLRLTGSQEGISAPTITPRLLLFIETR